MIVRVFDLADWAVESEPEDVVARRRERRRRAYRAATSEAGLSALTWACASCGASDHGQPMVGGGSVSTSSHGEWAVMALGPADVRIGVDITPRMAPPEAAAIARRMFSVGELAMEPAGGWQSGDEFARIWAAKEALGKAHGVGLSVDVVGESGGPLDSAIHSARLREMSADQSLPAALVGSLAVLPRPFPRSSATAPR